MSSTNKAASRYSSGNLNTYFIADLHLDPAQPRPYKLALEFLAQVPPAESLYVMGDLFEYWIGDDAGIPLYKDVVSALAALSDSGCQITIMHGNRDFLLGGAFAQATGASLVIADELMIDLDGEPVLLMHGDTLCTDDTEYQAFRKQVRDAQWQQAFLAKSIEERIAYATGLRKQSRDLSAEKTNELMDVTASQVGARFDARQCNTMIHGHTHRPKEHLDEPIGTKRLVLGDWHPEHAIYAVHNTAGLYLNRFEGVLPSQM